DDDGVAVAHLDHAAGEIGERRAGRGGKDGKKDGPFHRAFKLDHPPQFPRRKVPASPKLAQSSRARRRKACNFPGESARDTSSFRPSRKSERPTGAGRRRQRRSRALNRCACVTRLDALVLKVMLNETETAGPFCTQCGAAKGTCTARPGLRSNSRALRWES